MKVRPSGSQTKNSFFPRKYFISNLDVGKNVCEKLVISIFPIFISSEIISMSSFGSDHFN